MRKVIYECSNGTQTTVQCITLLITVHYIPYCQLHYSTLSNCWVLINLLYFYVDHICTIFYALHSLHYTLHYLQSITVGNCIFTWIIFTRFSSTKRWNIGTMQKTFYFAISRVIATWMKYVCHNCHMSYFAIGNLAQQNSLQAI